MQTLMSNKRSGWARIGASGGGRSSMGTPEASFAAAAVRGVAAQPPNPNYQPGFIDVFGRFIGESAVKLNSQLKSTNETLGDLGNQTSAPA